MAIVATIALRDSSASLADDLALAAATVRMLRPDDVYLALPWTRSEVIEACVDDVPAHSGGNPPRRRGSPRPLQGCAPREVRADCGARPDPSAVDAAAARRKARFRRRRRRARPRPARAAVRPRRGRHPSRRAGAGSVPPDPLRLQPGAVPHLQVPHHANAGRRRARSKRRRATIPASLASARCSGASASTSCRNCSMCSPATCRSSGRDRRRSPTTSATSSASPATRAATTSSPASPAGRKLMAFAAKSATTRTCRAHRSRSLLRRQLVALARPEDRAGDSAVRRRPQERLLRRAARARRAHLRRGAARVGDRLQHHAREAGARGVVRRRPRRAPASPGVASTAAA